jgi:hypothetical protein
MAHYAFLDDNNVVIDVIVGKDETELIEGLTPEEWYSNFRNRKCVRTSYNANIRKNYASINFTYDEIRDAFIPPKPYPSWILNEETCRWEAPIPYPDESKLFMWDEINQKWYEPEINNDY